MTAFIFTTTAITFLVLLAYSVEQLGDTYSSDMKARRIRIKELDEIIGY